MYRLTISIFLFVLSTSLSAKETLKTEVVDSLTYQYYLKGEWNKLILLGNEAIDNKIDFKYLRQRMGYAYFEMADYYASQNQYEKALVFDKKDSNTLLYLYYCGLYTGNSIFARYQYSKLPEGLKSKIGLKPVRIVDAVDVEYNYKIVDEYSRTNPTYMRFGINSKLGYKLNLYQSVSSYNQIVNVTTQTIQNEYYGSLNWAFSSHISMDLGYHYLNTIVDGTAYKGNLVFAGFYRTLNRFDIGLTGSDLSNSMGNFGQLGFHAGVVLPGKLNVYLKSSIYKMLETNNNRIVFSQTAGAFIVRNVWMQGNITLGNLKNYVDKNGLYVYNSLDETTFRTGGTLFWYLGNKLIIFGNYTYDKKLIIDTGSNYNQNSFSGGIIWKI